MNWGSVVDVTGSLRPVGGGVPSRPPLTVITAEQWLLNLRGGRLPAPSLADRLSSAPCAALSPAPGPSPQLCVTPTLVPPLSVYSLSCFQPFSSPPGTGKHIPV